MERISNERYELMKTEIKKTQKNGDFKTEIFLAERCGFYYHAGKISKLHGLFKKAYENFKKGEKENLCNLSSKNRILIKQSYLESIDEIKQILNPNTNNLKDANKFLKIEIYKEKCDKGDWNKSFWSKTEENLINHLERNQNRQNSCSRIRFYN